MAITAQDKQWMEKAIVLSRNGMRAKRGGPFGAIVVRDGEVLGEGENRVTSSCDPTAHAEIVAIRDACKNLKDFSLKGATIYTSCEPCPMCLAAIYWARIDRVVYANTRSDAANIGFDDARIYEEIALKLPQRSIHFDQALPEKAVEVFEEWVGMHEKQSY